MGVAHVLCPNAGYGEAKGLSYVAELFSSCLRSVESTVTSKSSSDFRIGESRLVSRGPTGNITPASLEPSDIDVKDESQFVNHFTVIQYFEGLREPFTNGSSSTHL